MTLHFNFCISKISNSVSLLHFSMYTVFYQRKAWSTWCGIWWPKNWWKSIGRHWLTNHYSDTASLITNESSVQLPLVTIHLSYSFSLWHLCTLGINWRAKCHLRFNGARKNIHSHASYYIDCSPSIYSLYFVWDAMANNTTNISV